MKCRNPIIGLATVAILALAASLGGCSAPKVAAPEASDIGGPFQLTAENGARVDQRVLNGKWSAVYFGYTFCPDTCPATLAALARVQADLGLKAKDFQVVFITVDPARDSPKQLAGYLSSPSFPKGTIGLTGSAADIKAVTSRFHVYYARQGSGPAYSVDHTSVIYLMDKEGRFVKPLAEGPPADMARQIASSMAGT